MDWFDNLNPVIQALIATIFTWGVTALGAVTVCFFKKVNKKILNTILGFSAGVMIAASFWSLTIHNIPEGMAIGVAFGGMANGTPGMSLVAAIMLAVGIGIQNFPEGAAVSLPLRNEGFSRFKSFMWGQASGLVEPIAAVIGVILVLTIRSILPFLLAFAAGAMIAVAARELLPESIQENKNLATLGLITGFVLMMVLDVALG